MVRCAPQLARLRADRSVYRTVSRFVQRRAPAPGAVVPLAARRRQSVRHQRDLHADPLPRAQVGRVLSARRHRRAGARAGAAVRRSSAASCASRRRSSASGPSATAAHGPPASRPAGAHEHFDLVVSNADLHHTYASCCAASRGGADARKRLERSTGRCRCSSSTSAPTGTTATSRAPHRAVRAALPGLLDDIFHGSRLPDDFSLYLHAPTVTDPSLAPPGCDASTCSRRCRTSATRRSTGTRSRRATPTRSSRRSSALLPDLRQHVVTRRWLTPVTFRDELNAYHGLGVLLRARR